MSPWVFAASLTLIWFGGFLVGLGVGVWLTLAGVIS